MYVMLSVATSADGYMDDLSADRLVLSTAGDWAEVYRLRADSDAILIGANTLRADNPSLGLKSQSLIDERIERGMSGEPMRVIIAGKGDISPELKLFHKGLGRVIVFSCVEHSLPDGVEVVVADRIDIPFIITELEKRGVRRLFVEGGAQILELFLSSGMVDQLRVATNQMINVGESVAPYFSLDRWRELFSQIESRDVDGMDVLTLSRLQNSCDEAEDRQLMRRALDCSLRSPHRDSCYRVGAVLKCVDGQIFDGYTLETSPTHHAEQAAIHKALLAGASLGGATIYSSMEPCSQRSSEPESCSALIMRYGLFRSVFALYEPSHFVECHGAENMRRAGIRVDVMEEFAAEVLAINSHVLF